MKTIVKTMLAVALFLGASTVQAQPGKDKGKELKEAGIKKAKKETDETTVTTPSRTEVESTTVSGQEIEGVKAKGKDKAKEAKDKVKEHGDDHDVDDAMEHASGELEEGKDKVKEEKEKKEKSNNGNAYGKNKGDLEGKEFGQARAEEAKARAAERRKETENKVVESETAATAADSKLEAAREKLEKAKADGTLTEEQVKVREDAINRAQEKIDALKKEVEIGRTVTTKKEVAAPAKTVTPK